MYETKERNLTKAQKEELKEYGYDPRSELKAGLEGASKGAAIGATVGTAGGPIGVGGAMAIGAGIGFIGGFTYDMISGGDNLSMALDAHKLDTQKKKKADAQRKEELQLTKKTTEKKKRAKDLAPIVGDETDQAIVALGAGDSHFDRFKTNVYGVA